MVEKNEEVRQNHKVKLALAMARGESITGWARQNHVPPRTALRWSKDPKVLRASQAWRRRALNRAIGRMAARAIKAADGIFNLAKGAESESVQLRAWRAIFADQIAVAKFSDLEDRIQELEALVDERNETPNGVSCHKAQSW